jgi:hypothetical protein
MRNWHYIRLFEEGKTQPSDEEILALTNTIKSVQDNTKNNIPAGYTYFGQFISHDLTFLGSGVREPGAGPVKIEDLSLRRNPTLNLDSIYGGGLDDSQIPFDQTTGKFILGTDESGKENDLPREDSGRARIADPRNDENLLIAQMQLLFMKLHNRLVGIFQKRGERDARLLYERTRDEVIRIFQYLVLHDFAKRILPADYTTRDGRHFESVYDVIIKQGQGQLMPRDPNKLAMSLELAGAALRFGHSMVDTQYDLNFENGIDGDRKRVLLEEVFRNTGTNINHMNPLKTDLKVDWRFFFRFSNYPYAETVHPNLARKIDLSVNFHMFKIPGANAAPDSHPTPEHVDIVKRNIQRGREFGLKSGQEICAILQERYEGAAQRIGLETLNSDLAFFDDLKSAGAEAMALNTPLWVYVLLEADIQQDSRLGKLGGWLVADGLLAAAQMSETHIPDDWSIETLILGEAEYKKEWRSEHDPVDMADIVAFIEPELVNKEVLRF